MNLSINTSAAATVSTANANLGPLALQPSPAAAGTSQASSSALAVTPQETQQQIQQRLAVFLAVPQRLSMDSEDIANALVPSMQALILQRPDLANAQFDFSSDNGAIKVTSNTLSESDRAWLQDTFNQNGALVKAVNAFHDDTVAGYALYANADGHPLSQTDMDAVSKQADGMTQFMSLFKRLGVAAQPGINSSGGTYLAQNGATINFEQPSTAIGFLTFMQSAKAGSDGNATLQLPKGRVIHNALKIDVFANPDAMPQFRPPSDSRSIGVHEVA